MTNKKEHSVKGMKATEYLVDDMQITDETIKKRLGNMDLFRVVSMLLIVLIHSIDHSGVLEAAVPGTFSYYWVYFGYALTQTCVNGFVLLSGYFLVTSEFSWKKILNLWAETVFYTLAIRVALILFGEKPFSLVSIIAAFFPIITGMYWFITIYVGLYILFPFLNIWIRAMKKEEVFRLNIWLFFLFSVWISVHPDIAGMNTGRAWGLAWFIVLYFAAAYIRLYYKPNGKPFLFLAGAIILALILSIVWDIAVTLDSGLLISVIGNWYSYDSVPAYICSLLLMLGFLNIKDSGNLFWTLIKKVSPLTFGVYLIHAQSDIQRMIWDVTRLKNLLGKWYFPIAQIVVVIVIFTACILIDYVRASAVGFLAAKIRINK